jgi:uncharacterized protein YndB with AHSA1/START domain
MRTFTTRREIPAGPASVFAAFQSPGRLAKWWGPDGFNNTIETFEFQPGGRWVFSLHGRDGKTYPNAPVFEMIIPDRRHGSVAPALSGSTAGVDGASRDGPGIRLRRKRE